MSADERLALHELRAHLVRNGIKPALRGVTFDGEGAHAHCGDGVYSTKELRLMAEWLEARLAAPVLSRADDSADSE